MFIFIFFPTEFAIYIKIFKKFDKTQEFIIIIIFKFLITDQYLTYLLTFINLTT